LAQFIPPNRNLRREGFRNTGRPLFMVLDLIMGLMVAYLVEMGMLMRVMMRVRAPPMPWLVSPTVGQRKAGTHGRTCLEEEKKDMVGEASIAAFLHELCMHMVA